MKAKCGMYRRQERYIVLVWTEKTFPRCAAKSKRHALEYSFCNAVTRTDSVQKVCGGI